MGMREADRQTDGSQGKEGERSRVSVRDKEGGYVPNEREECVMRSMVPGRRQSTWSTCWYPNKYSQSIVLAEVDDDSGQTVLVGMAGSAGTYTRSVMARHAMLVYLRPRRPARGSDT